MVETTEYDAAVEEERARQALREAGKVGKATKTDFERVKAAKERLNRARGD